MERTAGNLLEEIVNTQLIASKKLGLQLYSGKEMIFASNLNELGSKFFPN